MKELQKAAGAAPRDLQLSRKLTFEQGMEIYRAEVNALPRLNSKTKQFRMRFEHTLRRTWPDLFATELRRVTPEACNTWLQRFENGGSTFLPKRAKVKKTAGNSPTTVNGAIAFLQRIFAIGVKAGIAYRNPAQDLERKPAKKKLLRLPNRSQFAAIVAYIRRQPGWGRIAGEDGERAAHRADDRGFSAVGGADQRRHYTRTQRAGVSRQGMSWFTGVGLQGGRRAETQPPRSPASVRYHLHRVRR